MAILKYIIKRNDLQPSIKVAVKNRSDGSIKDLTGSTAVFTMKQKGADSIKINRVAAIVDGPNGLLQYDLQGTDTDILGSEETNDPFEGEFEITPLTGGKFTMPASENLIIDIVEDLDNI